MKIESRNEGKLTHVEVSGRIDASTSASVDTASDAALESAGQSVIFDLREVSYVSSAGLRAFVRAAKKAKAGGGGIAIFGLQANVAEIFAAAGFDRIIPIAATEAQAREKLGGLKTMSDVKYLTLADEIVVLMLDDVTGALKGECLAVAPVAIVGGILMELALQGRIDTDLEALYVVDETPVGDELLDSTLEIIRSETAAHPSAWWIEHLANRSVDYVLWILTRLVSAGVLREEQRKFLWVFSRRAYPATSGLEGREAKARLTAVLYSGEVPDPRDTLLLGLAKATDVLYAMFSRQEMATLAPRIDEVVALEEMGRSVSLVSAQVREAMAAVLLAGYP